MTTATPPAADAVAAAADPSTLDGIVGRLTASTTDTSAVGAALEELTVKTSAPLSEELQFLSDMRPSPLEPDQKEAAECGMTIYSLANSPRQTQLLGLEKRESNLYVERDFFPDLYATMVEKWEKRPRAKIILTGNAGIGKSWFQVYILRRLLIERGKHGVPFGFVLRHVGTKYHLIDLNNRSGYRMKGDEHDIETLISSHGQILYMYEPADKINQPPMTTTAASLSTLSPRPTRIHEYCKSQPTMLYMPVWGFDELEFVAALEIKVTNEWDVFHDNLIVFGGIARYALQFDVNMRADNKRKVDKRCSAVNASMLRSIAAEIDDDPNSEIRNNISGFVVSYDVPRDGQERFVKHDLTMTSEYAHQKVLNLMDLKSVDEYLTKLGTHLSGKSMDVTGKDLEVSVVHLLASGQKTVPWQYHAVGGTNWEKLPLTKREVNRQEEFDPKKVNYPRSNTFPLTDCFVIIDNRYWAFQTTWRHNHAFKLGTLLRFRKLLKLNPADSLNILFVNPIHTETYIQRSKLGYLLKGERLNKPLRNHKQKVLLDENGVADMWNHTHIYVARPKGGDWRAAIKAYRSKAQGSHN